MNHQVAEALATVEQWHQSSIKAGVAVRLLMAVAKQANIKESHLCRMLEVDCRKLQWLSRRGIGPVKRVKSVELISE